LIAKQKSLHYRHSQAFEILDNPEMVSGDPELQDLSFGRQNLVIDVGVIL